MEQYKSHNAIFPIYLWMICRMNIRHNSIRSRLPNNVVWRIGRKYSVDVNLSFNLSSWTNSLDIQNAKRTPLEKVWATHTLSIKLAIKSCKNSIYNMQRYVLINFITHRNSVVVQNQVVEASSPPSDECIRWMPLFTLKNATAQQKNI